MKMAGCPTCGQPLLMTKLGVKFRANGRPTIKPDILAMIEDATKGRGGIDSEALGCVFFPGVSKRLQAARIRVHVCQINDMLASTDYRIVNARPYRRDGAFYKLAIIQEEAA